MPRQAAIALFADDFDAIDAAARRAANKVDEAPPSPPSYGQEELDAACTLARDEGHARGLADAAMSEAANITATLARISDLLADAAGAATRVTETNTDFVARLLFATMLAGFPKLREKYGEDEIQVIVRRALPGLVQETEVTFHVHPTMVPVIQAELVAVPLKEKQHMTIEPSEAIPIGDARITWPNGGLIRDTRKIHAAIADILGPLGLLPDPVPESVEAQSR
jgi:flagellar biosynthesis/type III secretory pathway protein FliH